jgi:hypothetical protein
MKLGAYHIILDCYFDLRSVAIHSDDIPDTDEYDDAGAVNDPNNPIWQGSEIHNNPRGTAPHMPDANEVTQD